MEDMMRDERTREAVADRTNMGRYLAIGFVALWLVTLLTLVGHVGAGGARCMGRPAAARHDLSSRCPRCRRRALR